MSHWLGASCALTALSFVAVATAQLCEWSGLGRAMDETGVGVHALTVFDDGGGPALYAGGSFRRVDGRIAFHIARWDGASWSPVGDGLEDGIVFSLAVFDDGRGGGPALYAGGTFETSGGEQVRRVARWDGASWSEVGGGVAGGPTTKPGVYALTVFDDGSGPALYAGGTFGSAGGVAATWGTARWDGETWTSVGGGIGSYIYSLSVFDDGSGPALYAGGRFPGNIAKWDGQSWSGVGGGMNDRVSKLVVFDDGAGAAIHAAGRFTSAGGTPAKHLAKWDGASWAEVGGGGPGTGALAVFDDGRGPALYVGGGIGTAGGMPVNCIARWDGKAWEALGEGLGGTAVPGVSALTVFDDGDGPALYVGGGFSMAGDVSANNVARWRCDVARCLADCDASGALDFLDFLCFQNRFAAADPLADCDGSTTLDFFDFLCFQNVFAAGCP